MHSQKKILREEKMKKKILFIVNPISGTDNKKNIVSAIDKYLDKGKFDHSVVYTEYAGHATTLALEAAESGVDIIVAVGGDGTINEVARSVVQTSAALGIIPCGSGNGLARHLHIPMNMKRNIEIINACNISNLDYGKINDKPFFCTCGVGFDAFVSKKFAEGGKRGFLSYIENTLREGVRYKSEKYTIEFDDHSEKHEAFLIACANASQYGNNAYIAPLASMEDGMMDITIMEPFYTIESALVLVQMFSKSLHKNPHIKTFKSSKIKITRPTEGAVHCDGDPFVMGKEITVEIIKGQLRVVTPLEENLTIREEGRKVLKNLADICLEILDVKHKK